MYFFSPFQNFVLKFCIQVSRILFFSNLFEQKLFKCSEDPTRCGIVRNHNWLFTLNPHHAMIASLYSLSTLCKPAPTNVSAFTIWYRSIQSMSDLQLDMQKAPYFLCSILVDQLYAKGVYPCSFVTKSNQAWTKYAFKNFYRTVTHVHDFSRPQIKPFLHQANITHPPTIKTLQTTESTKLSLLSLALCSFQQSKCIVPWRETGHDGCLYCEKLTC